MQYFQLKQVYSDIEFFKSIFLSESQKNYRKLQKQAQSSHKFWQRVMNECAKRRFLKGKQMEQKKCQQIQNFPQFRQCYQSQKHRLQKYMIQLQFFQNKYQTCISEGLSAQYPIDNVEKVCGNRIIKYIRSHNDTL